MSEKNTESIATVSDDIQKIIDLYGNHKYVSSITKEGNIYYTDAFYSEMAEMMDVKNMTAVEAYQALGFDTSILSEARANSAGTRALKKRHTFKIFEKNPADFNSSTTFEEMVHKCALGEMTRDELYANMASRLIILEAERDSFKKKQRS